MAEFQAFSPDAQVKGEAILSLIQGVGPMKSHALKVLAEHGIEDPQKDKMYNQQTYLDALRKIFESVGPNTVFMAGKRLADLVDFPPVKDLKELMQWIEGGYKFHHRGKDPGGYSFSQPSDREIRITCRTPYPCEYDRGTLAGFAQKMRPADALIVSVEHDDSGCRKQGAEACTYVISW